jgi:hypothetical protein
MLDGNNVILEAKNTIFSSKYGMSLFTFLYLGKLNTYPQNLMLTRGIKNLRGDIILYKGDVKISI